MPNGWMYAPSFFNRREPHANRTRETKKKPFVLKIPTQAQTLFVYLKDATTKS